ncbi:MAG: LamG domain-containing protein [Phycisphaerae bacterium]|nr:LamG domain-containing protein [Phycisphaerae bacterium]
MAFGRILGGVLLAACSSVGAAEDKGLVGRWDFAEGRDNHIHDTSGRANHGLSNGINWVELEQGYGLEFDGHSARVNCGSSQSLDLRNAVSLEAWIFPAAAPFGEPGIAGKSFESYGMTYYRDGWVYWYINSGGNKVSTPVEPKRWTHVVGTFDGKQLKIYVDGRPAGTTPSEFKTVKPGGDFLIGCIGKGGSRTPSFKGVIGSVRVYDRALRDEEISAKYKAEIRRYPAPPARYDRLVATVFPYLDRGEVCVDLDYSCLGRLSEGVKGLVEIRRADAAAADPIQRHPLPALPETGLLLDARIEVGKLAPGEYELRFIVEAGASKQAECKVPLKHSDQIAIPSPVEKRVEALAPRGKPASYAIEIGKGGGFTIVLEEDRYPVESTYSYPNGGINTLWACRKPGPEAERPEPEWKVTTKKVDESTHSVQAVGRHYAVDRRIELGPGRVLVRDTITNKSGAELGILLSNHIRANEIQGLKVTRYPNPSVFLSKPGQGVGIVALDDVYLEQHATFAEGGRAGIRSGRFGLDKGKSYTLEWSIYLNETGDYYDFVNAFRKDAGYAPRVEGGFAFTDRRESPSGEYVKTRALKYASIGCLGHPPDDPGLSLEGVEFIEYPKECALLKGTFAETFRRFPDMKVMFHIAHSLYTTNKPVERFGDSRVLNSAGKQTDYGSQNVSYYLKYFSKQRVEEGYRWYIFYPTMDNSFGKVMLEGIDVMLNKIGANSMFADGFSHGYGGRFTYDRWDGHTVEIDPKTKTIKRKYASVNLLAQDVLVETVRRVRAKGGVVIANSYPGTRTLHREPGLLYCLETAGGGKVCAHLHLAPSVIALGNPANCKSARDVYDDIRDKIEWGGLYFYYGEKEVPPETIVTRMYPITVEEIHRGIIRGPERIITLRSGVYGWRDDRSLHMVYRYDGRGVAVPHGFVTTIDGKGARTKVDLERNESAIVVKLPIAAKTAGPINILARGYDSEGVELILNGQGPVALQLRDGEFRIRPGASYQVAVGADRKRVAAGGTLRIELDLDGQTRVSVSKP